MVENGVGMVKEVEKLAMFVQRKSFEDLSKEEILALKVRVLDSLGCAFGALHSPLIKQLQAQLDDFGGNPLSSLIGGGKSAPDRAAFYNGALIRYLDFNDSFLAKQETCHPSDNLSAVLAAAEYAKCTGKEFLTALAIAYQVQCRLSEEAPVRNKGFDHTTQGAYGVAAGVSKALRLSVRQTANAIAMGAVPNNALRVTRTGSLSNWKGLAFPHAAFAVTHTTFLALHGVTGPLEVFEGNKGFKETISGPFSIDWEKEGLDRVTKTIIKKYNAEIHSQSTLEGILELGLKADEIETIEVDIFDVAYHIIGGGEEGSKKIVRTKEEADHSLPYMIAAAILDGEVSPKQYSAERISKSDVQQLLQKVTIRPSQEYSQRFPNEMAVKIIIKMKNQQVLTVEKTDYEGFFTKPATIEQAVKKFKTLAGEKTQLVDVILNLENNAIHDLTSLLRKENK